MGSRGSPSGPRRLNIETQRRDIIVIGASAGGIDALRQLLARLPAFLPAAIAAVVHLSPTLESSLPRVLADVTELTVFPASGNAEFRHGHVYVGVPDRHLVLQEHGLALTRGAKEHFHRPAVDQLFYSAAKVYGPRVVAVVLSGGGYDGAAGAVAIKHSGGLVLAQEPSEALLSFMPRAVIARGVVDVVLSVVAIAATLPRLAAGEVIDLT